MQRHLTLCALLIAARANAAEPPATNSAAAAPASGLECHAIARTDYDKALVEAKRKPGAKVSSFKFVTRIVYDTDNTADFFTRGSNKAHPAYVRRTVAINGSDISIDTQGYTAGSASACAHWLKGFVAENAKIKAAIAKVQP